MREFLELHDYRTVEARNGREALDYLVGYNRLPCLIILDLSMPIMNGWEFLAIVKSYERLAEVPVVLVSGDEPCLDPLKHGTIAGLPAQAL